MAFVPSVWVTCRFTAVIDGGALAPAGGYKGMLLGLLVDVLAGVLSGPNCSFQAPVFKNNTGGEPKVGQFFIAVSPGERRHECRTRAAQTGIEVPLQLIEKLEAFATSS